MADVRQTSYRFYMVNSIALSGIKPNKNAPVNRFRQIFQKISAQLICAARYNLSALRDIYGNRKIGKAIFNIKGKRNVCNGGWFAKYRQPQKTMIKKDTQYRKGREYPFLICTLQDQSELIMG